MASTGYPDSYYTATAVGIHDHPQLSGWHAAALSRHGAWHVVLFFKGQTVNRNQEQ